MKTKISTKTLALAGTLALATTPAFMLVGCDDGVDSAEDVGEAVDDAAFDAGDAIDDAADEVDDAVEDMSDG
jgi:hypothetical protein